MTHIENVRKQLTYKPFRSFWLETIGGTRIRVEKAEWFYEVPGTNQLAIFDNNGVTISYWEDLTETIQIDK